VGDFAYGLSTVGAPLVYSRSSPTTKKVANAVEEGAAPGTINPKS
jgi:hypothetical protein